MAVEETARVKAVTSHVVKVTGVSEELLELLDARVKQQRAAGRAEYIRELIRRDALASFAARTVREPAVGRHKSRHRRPEPRSEHQLLDEYHALVDLELQPGLSPEQQARLREVESALDQAEARAPETRAMFARLDETAGKLEALLAAVRALPQAPAAE